MVRNNDSSYLARVEKWVKRSLKKKVTITSNVIVAFMITGAFFMMPEVVNAKWERLGIKTANNSVGTTQIVDNMNIKGVVALNPNEKGENGADISYVPDYSTKIVVIGSNAQVKGDSPPREATVIGADSESRGAQAVVVGFKSRADAQSVALGSNVYALQTSAVAIGSDDNPEYTELITEYDYKKYFQTLYDKLDPEGTTYGYKDGKLIDEEKAVFSPTVANGAGAIALGSRALANDPGATALGTLAFAIGRGATALGTLSRAQGVGSIALGNKTKIFAENSVGTGNEVQVLKTGGMGYGYKAYSGGEGSIAIGRNVYANTLMNRRDDNDNVKDAEDYVLDLNKLREVIGDNDENKFNNYIESIDSKIKSGIVPKLHENEYNVADVVQSNSKNNAIVIGRSSIGLGSNSIALGKGAFSLGDNSFAIGSYSLTKDEAKNAIAVGLLSRALSENSIAFGVGTAVSNDSKRSISIGSSSVISGENSAILGTDSYVQGKDSILVGTKGSIYGDSNLSFGNEVNIQQSENNLSLGNKTKIGQGVTSSVVLGNEASIGAEDLQKDTNIENATAIGFGAKVVEGSGTKETGINSVALGKGAIATLENSVALGVESATDYTFEQLQKTPWASKGAISIPTSGNTGVISVGSRGQERRIVNVASGAFDTDAVNVAQLKTLEERIDTQMNGLNEGGGIQYLSVEKSKGEAGKAKATIDKITNYNKYVKLQKELMYIKVREEIAGEKFNQKTIEELQKKVDDILKGDSVIPQGEHDPFKDVIAKINSAKDKTGEAKSQAFSEIMKEIGTIADGLEADGYPQKNIAGDMEAAKKNNYLNQGAQGIDSIAFGYGAATSGDNDGEAGKHAIAIGFEAKANAASSIALGDNATTGAGSSNSVAIGKNSHITDNASDSIVIGNGAKATQKNSIALGKGAETGTVSKVISAKIGDITYGNFAGDPVTNDESRVLSIGKTGEERTITNVAAGRVLENSTDAINGSQLYVTNKVLSNLAKTSENVLGDSFVLNENGEISVKNGDIGGTGKTTVSEAVASLGNKVITLSDRVNNKISKNLSSDPTFVLAGNDDVVVEVNDTNDQMNFSINKGEVKLDDKKVVSGDAVSKAIAAAKPSVVGEDVIEVEHSTQNEADKFIVSLNKEKLINKLGDTYITKNDYKVGDGIEADKWKEKLGVADLGLHYKADGESDRITTLAKGFTFSGDKNIKVSTEDGGVVKHTLNEDLVGINSIAGNGQKISLTSAGTDLNNGKIINMGSGTIGDGSTDAVTGGDIYKTLQEYAKIVIFLISI